MLFMEYRIFLFYIKGGRALNYLETVTRSPITAKFSETLNGISCIRGFEYQENFRKIYHQKLNDFYSMNCSDNYFILLEKKIIPPFIKWKTEEIYNWFEEMG